MKYYIITHGCQMNKSDSERVATVLREIGYRPALKESEADLVVVVACSVRQAAVDRIYGKARALAKLKITNPYFVSVLTGCVLPRDKRKLAEKFDYVFSIDKISDLKSEILNLKSNENDYFKIKASHSNDFSAFVPIMTGCNNFCSYCAVPYVRGREESRGVKDILREIKGLAKTGYSEVILLGQNVNTYNPKDVKSFSKNNPYKDYFAALLWEINQIKGIERIFFTAPHPKDMSDEVISALALPKMLNYLHLPVQSGDDEILKKMNRNYTASDYLKLVKKIKKIRPNISLGTDIIVGFPGETKKQFQNTVELYKKADFDISYHAMYSPRVGTVAAKMKDNVSRQEKKRRWNVLQKLMEKNTFKKNQIYLGNIVSVLVDGYEKGCYVGNSREMKRVRFKGDGVIGKMFNIKIEKAHTWILEGEIAYDK
ncbi:tRNA (N6-isopentenyl adenosine(37)-C2)-methylthiotransferase MiaB [Candidatus Falkowbacteria bacterium RIFOXYD2_FULL_39_16]|nr:MAG: tRNA (N6-isopentenyl adenosine(37)-C2)-methylthiotransferase MiaB [Candidatus Falkowbacteria bacterium RIFOXYD2_FULL_39_16]